MITRILPASLIEFIIQDSRKRLATLVVHAIARTREQVAILEQCCHILEFRCMVTRVATTVVIQHITHHPGERLTCFVINSATSTSQLQPIFVGNAFQTTREQRAHFVMATVHITRKRNTIFEIIAITALTGQLNPVCIVITVEVPTVHQGTVFVVLLTFINTLRQFSTNVILAIH